MYYELRWKNWQNGEVWFAICYTKEQVEEEKLDMEFNAPDYVEYCGCLEVKEEGDE